MIDLQKYQKFCRTLACKINKNFSDEETFMLMHSSLGLASEVGEIVDEIKKSHIYDHGLDEEAMHRIKKELGDLCYYLALTTDVLGLTIEEVIELNVKKLEHRFPEGKFTITHSKEKSDEGVV